MVYNSNLAKSAFYFVFALMVIGCWGVDLYAQSKGNTPQSVQVIPRRPDDYHRNDDYHKKDNHQRRDDYHRRDDHHRKPVERLFPMSDENFSFFLSKVKACSFTNNKLDLVEVGCINNYFTCRQVLSVMKELSFDDDKVSVVRIMYPCILDKENVEMLAEYFTFDSYKKKVRALFVN
jgi:hypothetical protein